MAPTSETGTPEPLSGALDRLYAAPLEQFVSLRRDLVASLRARGELAASRLVATAPKPTRTAWAINQVARRRPELLRAVFDARDAAAAAHKRGSAEQVRRTVREYRARLADAVRGANDIFGGVGIALQAGQSRRVSDSLHATGAGGPDLRAKLLEGRLAREVDVEDPFGGIDANALRPRMSPKEHLPDDGTLRKREAAANDARALTLQREREERKQAIEQSKVRVAALAQKVREARETVRETEAAARLAVAASEKARAAAAEADRRFDDARRELEALTK